MVAGSGLGLDLESAPTVEATLQEIVPFEVRGVLGHSHAVELFEPGESGGALFYQRGRLHAYQGYSAHEVVFTIRLAALLGLRTLIMSNAAGGIDPSSAPGDIRVIRDHLNLTALNPLHGGMPAEWGPTFPDMADAYDPELRRLALDTADRLGVALGEGVYASVQGPSFETPAEVEMLRRSGADLVGMSTVLEVIAARHMGVSCLCFSVVSNHAAGVSDAPVDHEEVLDVGREAGERLGPLLSAILAALPR